MAQKTIAEERGTPDSGWIILSKQFPPSLNKRVAVEVVQDGETPEAYGMGIERPGYLYADSVPTGYASNPFYTAATEPTGYPEAILTWYWWFDRLWALSGDGKEVYYGAHGYKDYYIPQRRAIVGYGSTSGKTYTTLCPFGDSMALFSSGKVDVIKNAASPSANFQLAELIQTQGCAAANRAISLGQTLYFLNANGVWTVGDFDAAEVTQAVRNSLAPFSTATSTVLHSDEQRGIVVGLDGSSVVKFAIAHGEQPTLIDYSTSGFRYTTPTFMAVAGNPIVMDKIALVYEETGTSAKSVTFQVKINDTWTSEQTQKLQSKQELGRVEIPLNHVVACRRWALRLTALSSNVYINNIQAKVKQGGVIGYTN